jgi:peptidoglycan/LPS O-acetylase OafA/YrhL
LEEERVAPGVRPIARYYRPELDALRVFAFLGAFLFHRMDYVPTDPAKNPWAWRIGTVGAFGVPVFFLLSAFLITELLLREKDRTGTVHVGAFYVRRILRIWPLYFAVFYGLALLNHFVPGTGTDDPHAWLSFTLFAGNWWITFKGWIAGPVDPLWSVSVEEQFYLVVPLVIALGGRRAVTVISAAIFLASYATIIVYAAHRSPGDHGEWTNSLVHFQFFSAGTMIAILLHGRLPRLKPWLRFGGLVVGLFFWLIAVTRFQVRSWDPQPSLIGAIAGWLLVLTGTILLFLSMLGIAARYIPAWLAHFGRISYGLYVFHSLILLLTFQYLLPALGLHAGQPLVDGFGTVVALLASLIVASLSFTWFERPILRLKQRFTYVPAREDC